MYHRYRNITSFCVLILSIFLLVGCSLFGKTSSTNNTAKKPASTATTTTNHPTNSTIGPENGPLVIETPTPIPNGSPTSQQIGLADRILLIENVSRQDNNATTTITITLQFKNMSSKDIKNQVSYYQLVATEGDMFGLPPTASTSDFFGTVSPGSTHNGVLVFQQIPSAAIKKLQLLYHAESAQAIFISLNIQ